jgi:signal transduction histidine kinase
VRGSLRTWLSAGALVWMTTVVVAVIALVSRILRNHPAHREPVTYFAAMAIIGAAFVVGGWFLVRKAVAPLWRLRAALSLVREGRSQRIEGEYPSEVEPLVADLNALLADRERAVARALTTAGDLAHGLKTPLAILTQEAEQARAAGHHELADTLRQQVERMQRQIDHHLARARATASVGEGPAMRCRVLPSVEGLVRTMRRLHAGRTLAIDVDVAPEHEIRGRGEDLDEMLGNLLDNACKWARSRVAVTSAVVGEMLVITVDDDGGGLDAALREKVMQRGVRADQQVAGSGLGLAIVTDLAELYGGSVSLEPSPAGGTRACLRLPCPHGDTVRRA